MDAIFSSSLVNFTVFLILGSAIVYYILKYDKMQRNKIRTVLSQTQDVQPLLMAKSMSQKIRAIKPELNSFERREIAKKLDELVSAYDKGQISLPEYCNKLNSLLAMVAA